MKTTFVAFLLMLLCGCTGGRLVYMPDSIGPVAQDKGVLLVSVTMDRALGLSLRYEKANQQKSKIYHVLKAEYYDPRSETLIRDFSEIDKKIGSVIAVQLEPGIYNMTGWFHTIPLLTGGYMEVRSVEGAPPLAFTIDTGKITYIGNFHASTNFGKNIIGITVPAGSTPKVSNTINIDRTVLESKYPDLKRVPINTAILDISEWLN